MTMKTVPIRVRDINTFVTNELLTPIQFYRVGRVAQSV
jgi:hypothetical protein